MVQPLSKQTGPSGADFPQIGFFGVNPPPAQPPVTNIYIQTAPTATEPPKQTAEKVEKAASSMSIGLNVPTLLAAGAIFNPSIYNDISKGILDFSDGTTTEVVKGTAVLTKGAKLRQWITKEFFEPELVPGWFSWSSHPSKFDRWIATPLTDTATAMKNFFFSQQGTIYGTRPSPFMTDYVTPVMNAGSKVVESVSNMASSTYNGVANAASAVSNGISSAGSSVAKAASATENAISGVASSAYKSAANAASAVGDLATSGYNGVAGAVSASGNAISGVASSAYKSAANAASAVGDLATSGYNGVAGAVSASGNAISGVASSAYKSAANAASAVGDLATSGYNGVAGAVSASGNAISGVASSVATGASNAVSFVTTNVGSAFDKTTEAVSNAAGAVIATLGQETGISLFGYSVTYGGALGILSATAAAGAALGYLNSKNNEQQ